MWSDFYWPQLVGAAPIVAFHVAEVLTQRQAGEN
jgi:hypothetical protein